MKIVWNNRFLGDIGNEALVSINGTDLPVQYCFNRRFFSHKFRSNGLRYELGVCLRTGDIVWINGPFRAGQSDINIARQAVTSALEDGEKVEADGGYDGEKLHIKIPTDAMDAEEHRMKTIARSRHETANKRMKIYQILTKPFRHDLSKNSSAFRAVAVITQLNIMNGFPLFDVEYVDLCRNEEEH